MPKHILLVDDDEDDQQIFLGVIQSIDPSIRCEVAWNGLEALKLLDSQDTPDLIFLDLNMPLMNGFQFLEEFNDTPHHQRIPVIILTTCSDKASHQRAIAMGASHYITKPDRISRWEEVLNEIFTGRETVKAVSHSK
jgi:CheY-like chemotaxis protein